jgi:hypothetical protein
LFEESEPGNGENYLKVFCFSRDWSFMEEGAKGIYFWQLDQKLFSV